MVGQPYWPVGLPEPLMGAEFTTAQGRINSDGDVCVSDRVTDPNYRYTLPAQWLMSEREYQVFKAWYHHILGDGAAWFAVEWTGIPALAQFAEKYEASQSGLLRSVNAEIRVDYAISA